ncbi:MAG TPA: serine hydrolase [Gemmatimonadaceae bacterium]|nr:serine hydrolase [Gemmatimonadaceae bacterium]
MRGISAGSRGVLAWTATIVVAFIVGLLSLAPQKLTWFLAGIVIVLVGAGWLGIRRRIEIALSRCANRHLITKGEASPFEAAWNGNALPTEYALAMRLKVLLVLLMIGLPSFGQDTTAIDKAVAEVLAKTGTPSASIAVVKDGKLAYSRAYGTANLESRTPATPQMRYSIGSVSKQFTATAVLMLAEEGKLSLDDKVVRWLPELTRASDISIRQLLSMTSGYQDYWPQDYVMPMMLEPVTAQDITRRWAGIPLDFEPGSKWQYSNTNYIIAGLIVEKVSGMAFFDFLQKRVFAPLQMTSVTSVDVAPLGPAEPARYSQYALGPLRPAPKEGRGWLFAAGELGMTASDLAKWDISMIDQTLMKPSSYREMLTDTRLSSGIGSRYGLGVALELVDGRRLIQHGGAVSGSTARNDVYPDDRAAVVVLANMDATSATVEIASRIRTILFAPAGTAGPLEQVRKIFAGLQKGQINRNLFTSNANAYFSDTTVKDFAASLGPLGTPQEFTQTSQSLRGGMTLRRYRIVFPKKNLRVWTFTMPDGKLEQFMAAAE